MAATDNKLTVECRATSVAENQESCRWSLFNREQTGIAVKQESCITGGRRLEDGAEQYDIVSLWLSVEVQ